MDYKVITYKDKKLYYEHKIRHRAKEALEVVNSVVYNLKDPYNYYAAGHKYVIMVYRNNERIKTIVIDRR